LRFVIAIVLFVVAFVAIGFGIAQRTILAGPGSFSTEVSTGAAPITVVDSDVLNALPGTQTVSIVGQGEIFLAYGRTTDVLAWIDDLAYNHVTFDRDSLQVVTETISGAGTDSVGETAVPTPPAADPAATATPSPSATPGSDEPQIVPFSGDVPDPRASDLWMQEFDGTDELVRKINPPEGISLIIMSNGVDSAPQQLTFSWPLDNSAPQSGPLIIGGILSLLAGLAAFLWALVHARRRRGPRRKQPRLPKAPQPRRLKRAKQRRAITTGRTGFVVASAVAVSLALAGCTTGPGLLGSGLATPTPTSTDIGDVANLKPIAVTKQQLARIIDKVADTIDEADAAKDPKLAETRLAGPALAMRTANYTITTADPSLAAVSAFPGGNVEVVLPQQNDSWPRSVFTVVQPTDTSAAPVAMMLVQDSPRDNYKVHYLITLEPGLVVPPVAPTEIGSVQLNSDNRLGLLRPDQLAAAYGQVLIQGDAAPEFDKFDADTDTLRVDIGFDAKAARRAALPATAQIDFTNGEGAEPSISFPTNDSGQIVAVLLDDTETVTPLEAGAAINTPAAVKALSGIARTAKGITATYGVQLLFYVPPVGGSDASAQIELLGFSQGLVSAGEIG